MDQAESIGFLQYWGFSKWCNLMEDVQLNQNQFNILISSSGDLRHIFKTCLDLSQQKNLQINFYVHEKQKEPFCRQLLLLLILHTRNLSFRERTDLFLDIYGNALIRDKSAEYIEKVIPYLDNLISDEKKYKSALNQLIDFKEMKFKDRDEIVEIIRSWYSTVPFEMAKLRDQRLRHHYGTRYDYRSNLVDWDYQMSIKENSSIIHFFHYKEWRQSGLAFEQRFSSYPTPNRTLSSYLPGKKKITRESILVRGYWGDITVSPYFSFGTSTDIQPEKDELFKIRNLQQVSHSVEVSEFNVQHFIQKFDDLSEFHVKKADDQKSQFEKKTDLQKIDEDEKEDQEEQNQQINEVQNNQIEQKKNGNDDQNFVSQELLLVFQNLGIKIIPIFEDLDKIVTRQKFKQFFDSGFLGFFQSGLIKLQDLKNIFKQKASLYVETPKNIVTLKKEDKELAFQSLIKFSTENGWDSLNYHDDVIKLKKK